MNNSSILKKLLLLLLILIVSASLCFLAVACNHETEETPTEEEPDETETESPLILNGDFESATGTTYPKTPSSWSGSAGSGAVTGSENLIYGVVNLGESYDNRKSEWDNLANPDPSKTDNVLMIYNKNSTVYSYSNSFTTAIGAYYKISVKVKVVAITENGAYVRFTNNAYALFGPIVPLDDNDWQTFTLYLEASQITTASVSIALSMGIGTTGAVGYAFFDDAIAEKISQSEYKDADIDNVTSKKYSMLVPDQDFLNTTSTSMPYSPAGWTATAGTGTGNTAPTSYTYKGIMSLDSEKWTESITTTYGENPGLHEDASDNNVLFIKTYSNTPSAYGYVGKQDIRITLGTLVKISVFVNTSLAEVTGLDEDDEPYDNSTRGAWLVLSGAGEYMIEHIDTGNQWIECSFYVLGNQYRNKDFTLELWLGRGGADDKTTLTLGTVFFDTVRLEEVQVINSIEDRDDLLNTYGNPALYNPNYTKVIDLQSISGGSAEDNELIDNANFSVLTGEGLPEGWVFSAIEDVKNTDEDVDVKVISKADIENLEMTNAQWLEKYGLTPKAVKEGEEEQSANPLAPYTLAPVLLINNKQPSAYKMEYGDTLTIKQNLHYRLALWIKTADIPDGKGATINLLKDDDSSFLSFTTVNTQDYANELTNDYVEFVFFIQGSNTVSYDSLDNKTLTLSITLGSGTTYTPSSYVSGKVFIANINMEQVTYDEYNNATTGTYLKKSSFSSSSATVTNGNFNLIDYTESDVNQQTGLLNKIAKPDSWTRYEEEDVLDVGVINVNNTALLESLGLGDKNDVYNDWVDDFATFRPVDFGAPNLGIIKTVGAATTKSMLALKSASMSLSTNSRYIFKAYAKSIGTVGEIYLTTTSTNAAPLVVEIDTDGKWKEYVFVVETGLMSSATAYFEVYFGNKDDADETYNGTILVDSFTYLTIENEEYETLAASGSSTSFMTDAFETTSVSSTPSKPNNWTGAGTTTSGYVKTETQVVGIFARDYGDYEAIGIRNDIKDDETTEDDETDTDIIPTTALTREEIFDSTGMEDGMTVGASVLMINNLKPSYYNYKTSSLSLSANKYYEISVYVRTVMLDKDAGAKVFVTVGGESTYSFATINTSTYDEDGVETRGGWQKYTYYIKTAESTSMSSVYLNLTFGEDTDDGKLTGYAFFDNVTLKELDSETFLIQYAKQYDLDEDGVALTNEDGTKVKAATYDDFMLFNRTIRVDDPDDQDEEEPVTPEPTQPKPDTSYLWAYISSIIIAVVLIAVIVVVLFRRYRPTRKGKAGTPSYDKDRAAKAVAKSKTSEDTTKDEYKD